MSGHLILYKVSRCNVQGQTSHVMRSSLVKPFSSPNMYAFVNYLNRLTLINCLSLTAVFHILVQQLEHDFVGPIHLEIQLRCISGMLTLAKESV